MPGIPAADIDTIIAQHLPVGVTLDVPTRDNLIAKYQLWIAILVEPIVVDPNIHTESFYSTLANQLIAEMVVLDLIELGAAAFMLSLGNQVGAAGKEVKKVTTGPADAEWYSASDSWQSIMKPGGAKDMLKQSTCGLASRLRIVLPWCPPLSHSPIPPSKVCPPTNPSINSWPN